MRYFAHIEVEIEADDHEEASDVAQDIADTVKDQHIFEAIDAFVVNVE